MKEIPAGYRTTLEVLVTPDMTVQFGELGPGYPVYATYQLARHFEEAGRKLLLPFLEPGEEGIGYGVSVEHTATALPGMAVKIVATFDRMEERRLHATMEAFNALGDPIGTGGTIQVVLPKARIEQDLESLRQRWQRAQANHRGT